MYAELFGKKLARARHDAGYTQREAGVLLKIPQSTIANWETGRTQPDLESIGIMADFYEISVDWLLGTKGQNFSQKRPVEPTAKKTGQVNSNISISAHL